MKPLMVSFVEGSVSSLSVCHSVSQSV